MPPEAAQSALRGIERGRRLVLSVALLVGASLLWSTLEKWLEFGGLSIPRGWGKELSNLAVTLLLCYGLYRGWALSAFLLAGAFTLMGFILAVGVGLALTGWLTGVALLPTDWGVVGWGVLHVAGMAYCVWAMFLCADSRRFLRWQRTGEADMLPPSVRLERWRVGNR